MDEKPLKEKAKAASEKAVGSAKKNKGLIAGAILGTVLVPIPVVGTIVGGAVGALFD